MATRRKQPTRTDLIHELRQRGLTRYPGAHLKSPWPGHLDLAVHDKTFAYLSAPGDPPGLSLKLPFSGPLALTLPDAEPTPYGLGKSGWVTISFADHAPPPPAQLEAWLDESYRAQAPKKLLAQFEASLAAGAAKAQGKAKAATKKGKKGAASVAPRPLRASAPTGRAKPVARTSLSRGGRPSAR